MATIQTSSTRRDVSVSTFSSASILERRSQLQRPLSSRLAARQQVGSSCCERARRPGDRRRDRPRVLARSSTTFLGRSRSGSPPIRCWRRLTSHFLQRQSDIGSYHTRRKTATTTAPLGSYMYSSMHVSSNSLWFPQFRVSFPHCLHPFL